MKPHVSVITLGVLDLEGEKRFYGEQLGWPVEQEDDNWACYLLAGGSTALALYPWDGVRNVRPFSRFQNSVVEGVY